LEQVITSFWRKPQQTKHLNETLTSTSSCYYDESRSLEDEARLGNLLKENFFTMKTFPPIHPLKANKHGVMKQIPAGIVLPVTCFPPTRLNSMNRRSTKQGRKRANYLQPERNSLQNRIGQNPSQQVMIISKPPPPLLLLHWTDRQTDRRSYTRVQTQKKKKTHKHTHTHCRKKKKEKFFFEIGVVLSKSCEEKWAEKFK